MTVSRKVAMVCPPALTVTVALPAARLLLTSEPPGKVVTLVNVVPDGSVSRMITGPAASTSGRLHEPPGAGPAATVTGVPATVNVKFVPTAMPAPATLQICRNPVVRAGRNRVHESDDRLPAVLDHYGSRARGQIAADQRPAWQGADGRQHGTGEQGFRDGYGTGRLDERRAARALRRRPGGTVTGVPATMNTKFVPATMPAPATLQICRNPVGGTGILAFSNVTTVCPPAATITVAGPAARSLLTSDPPGEALMAVNCTPMGRVSVTITGPAGNTSGAPQEPAGAGPAGTVTGVPATLNVKFVPSTMPVPATLQICRNPVVGVTESVKVAIVCAPAMTVTVAVPAAKLSCGQQSRAGQGGDGRHCGTGWQSL